MVAKLYYSPTSCGAANFIAANIAGLTIECEQVDFIEHKTASGVDFYTINPKGNVPCIVLDDGTVINENIATLIWIADQAPGAVAPLVETRDRYLLLQNLSYIASEMHQGIGGLFSPAHTPESKAFYNGLIQKRLTYLENYVVKDVNYITNNNFSVADLYLYIVLSWTYYVGVDLTAFPNTLAFYERIKNDSRVVAAHERIATSPSTVN